MQGSPPVVVDAPPQFVSELRRSASEDLADLRESTFALVSKGKANDQVVSMLAEAGWSEAFATWYVGEVQARGTEVELIVPASPQSQQNVSPQDVNALLKEPVCSYCGARFEGKTTRSPMGFPSFKCATCGEKVLLPLRSGYTGIYLFFSVVFLIFIVGSVMQGSDPLIGALVIVSAWGLIANAQVTSERKGRLMRMLAQGR